MRYTSIALLMFLIVLVLGCETETATAPGEDSKSDIRIIGLEIKQLSRPTQKEYGSFWSSGYGHFENTLIRQEGRVAYDLNVVMKNFGSAPGKVIKWGVVYTDNGG